MNDDDHRRTNHRSIVRIAGGERVDRQFAQSLPNACEIMNNDQNLNSICATRENDSNEKRISVGVSNSNSKITHIAEK